MADDNDIPEEFSDVEVANPFKIGDIILDGDEDSQVAVWEDGAPTWWALQFAKWRRYFNIPWEGPADPASTRPRQPDDPSLDADDSTEVKRENKKSSEEAGLDMHQFACGVLASRRNSWLNLEPCNAFVQINFTKLCKLALAGKIWHNKRSVDAGGFYSAAKTYQEHGGFRKASTNLKPLMVKQDSL